MELLQKRQYRKTQIALLLFLFGYLEPVSAQSDKSYLIQLRLNEANKLYEIGRMDSSSNVLNTIIGAKNFKDAGRLLKSEIHRLNALCYHYLKEDSLSTQQIDEMLVYSPFYATRESDPQEFLIKIRTAHPLPRIMLGLKAGTNATTVRVEKKYSIFNLTNQQQNSITENYEIGQGIDLGMSLQLYASPYFSLIAEAEVSRNYFGYTSTNNLLLSGPQTYSYKMRYDYIDVPVMLGINPMPRFVLKPSLFAGAFYRYLAGAGKQIRGTDFPYAINSNRFGYGLVLGVGLSYDRKRTRYSLNYRFKYGYSLANNPNNRYINSDISGVFILENYDVDNDILLNTSSITLSIFYLSKFKVFRKKINPFALGSLFK